jgi:hypothetical protein
MAQFELQPDGRVRIVGSGFDSFTGQYPQANPEIYRGESLQGRYPVILENQELATAPGVVRQFTNEIKADPKFQSDRKAKIEQLKRQYPQRRRELWEQTQGRALGLRDHTHPELMKIQQEAKTLAQQIDWSERNRLAQRQLSERYWGGNYNPQFMGAGQPLKSPSDMERTLGLSAMQIMALGNQEPEVLREQKRAVFKDLTPRLQGNASSLIQPNVVPQSDADWADYDAMGDTSPRSRQFLGQILDAEAQRLVNEGKLSKAVINPTGENRSWQEVAGIPGYRTAINKNYLPVIQSNRELIATAALPMPNRQPVPAMDMYGSKDQVQAFIDRTGEYPVASQVGITQRLPDGSTQVLSKTLPMSESAEAIYGDVIRNNMMPASSHYSPTIRDVMPDQAQKMMLREEDSYSALGNLKPTYSPEDAQTPEQLQYWVQEGLVGMPKDYVTRDGYGMSPVPAIKEKLGISNDPNYQMTPSDHKAVEVYSLMESQLGDKSKFERVPGEIDYAPQIVDTPYFDEHGNPTRLDRSIPGWTPSKEYAYGPLRPPAANPLANVTERVPLDKEQLFTPRTLEYNLPGLGFDNQSTAVPFLTGTEAERMQNQWVVGKLEGADKMQPYYRDIILADNKLSAAGKDARSAYDNAISGESLPINQPLDTPSRQVQVTPGELQASKALDQQVLMREALTGGIPRVDLIETPGLGGISSFDTDSEFRYGTRPLAGMERRDGAIAQPIPTNTLDFENPDLRFGEGQLLDRETNSNRVLDTATGEYRYKGGYAPGYEPLDPQELSRRADSLKQRMIGNPIGDAIQEVASRAPGQRVLSAVANTKAAAPVLESAIAASPAGKDLAAKYGPDMLKAIARKAAARGARIA